MQTRVTKKEPRGVESCVEDEEEDEDEEEGSREVHGRTGDLVTLEPPKGEEPASPASGSRKFLRQWPHQP